MRRRTSVTELAARRRARRFHTALAELVRRHGRALTQVRTAGEYDAVTASLRAGVLALVADDAEALMRHSAAEPPTSRTTRLLRRTASSLILTAFAVAIPLLPGVDRATGASKGAKQLQQWPPPDGRIRGVEESSHSLEEPRTQCPDLHGLGMFLQTKPPYVPCASLPRCRPRWPPTPPSGAQRQGPAVTVDHRVSVGGPLRIAATYAAADTVAE